MPSTNKRVLSEILATLINEWGALEVEQTLLSIAPGEQRKRAGHNLEHRHHGTKHSRNSAVQYVDKLPGTVENKDVLLQIAIKFDSKEFLPTLRDVFLFLSKRGADEIHLKNRQDSFRKVLDVLVSTPRDTLEKISKEGIYLGPSRLGPLADAIRATGESMRAAHTSAQGSKTDKS